MKWKGIKEIYHYKMCEYSINKNDNRELQGNLSS